MEPSETFLDDLRDALNHLYDPDVLRQNPLAALFGVAGRFDTPVELQRILTEAIESVGSPGSRSVHERRCHELLLYRYVQQNSQEEVANQLGVSVRQYRREQNQALYLLGARLWKLYKLDARPDPTPLLPPNVEALDRSTPAPPAPSEDGVLDEFAWLHCSAENATELPRTVAVVHELIDPLYRRLGLALHCATPPDRIVRAHPVAFQQILLNVLGMAAAGPGAPTVLLGFELDAADVAVVVTRHRPAGSGVAPEPDPDKLSMAARLAELCDGKLSVTSATEHFMARLCHVSVEPCEVMVVEDNEAIFNLMQRFGEDTRFRFGRVADPRLALAAAAQRRPHILILDIMMPEIDGLQLLMQVKAQPDLRNIPVAVCSVLPQADLAYALGAAAYIKKPFQRDDFIAVLNHLAEAPG
jgi:CheY-like chemotaxis protein